VIAAAGDDADRTSAREARTVGFASDTLVYAASADPALLDPSLVSDGESIRVARQIFEGPRWRPARRTKIVPKLATSWSGQQEQADLDVQAAERRQVLGRHALQRRRRLLQLHRWYTSRARSRTVAELLLDTVFLGFANPATGNPGRTRASTAAARRTASTRCR
jgi:hypothetical protein